MTLYYVALAPGYWKLFGLPMDAFRRCTGTGADSFSKPGDSIYFHDGDGVYVNLFIASEPDRQAKGVRILQENTFAEQARTTITIRCRNPISMRLRLRVPWWAEAGGEVKLNGHPLEVFGSPGSQVVGSRRRQDRDSVEVNLTGC